ATLAAEHAHRVQQGSVRRADLARKELHAADLAARARERERERGVEAALLRDGRAREVAVHGRVRQPLRPSGFEHPAGKSLSGPELERLAKRLELGERLARVPRADAAEDLLVGVDLPDRSE